VRYAQSRGLSLKVSDEFTVPLCATHHHQIHTTGKEREWWQERNLDPLIVACDLWQESRGLNPLANDGASSQERSTDVPPELPPEQRLDRDPTQAPT